MNDAAQQPPGWHLDKRVSWGHIVTTIVVWVAAFWWGARTQERVTVSETRISTNEKAIATLNETIRSQNNEIIRRLERIDSKMDTHVSDHYKRGN